MLRCLQRVVLLLCLALAPLASFSAKLQYFCAVVALRLRGELYSLTRGTHEILVKSLAVALPFLVCFRLRLSCDGPCDVNNPGRRKPQQNQQNKPLYGGYLVVFYILLIVENYCLRGEYQCLQVNVNEPRYISVNI